MRRTVKTKAGKWYNNRRSALPRWSAGKYPFIFLSYTPELVVGLAFEPGDQIQLYRGVWFTPTQEEEDLSSGARTVVSDKLLLDEFSCRRILKFLFQRNFPKIGHIADWEVTPSEKQIRKKLTGK